jgi:hypothetical protein
MLEPTQLAAWLRESGEEQAADIVDQCSFNFLYVDTLFELGGGERAYDLLDVNVEAPAKILKEVGSTLSKVVEHIEEALRDMASSLGCHIRDVHWVPRVPKTQSQVEQEITERLKVVDSEHVREAWKKALERKNQDPDGAITAARTLLEAVSKHVLDKAGGTYTDSMDLPNLYHQAVQALSLAPSQQTDEVLKRVLGNCQAVVGGVAAMRNRLGDAHGKGLSGEKPSALHAELAVNLAGAVSMFLVGAWETTIAQQSK